MLIPDPRAPFALALTGLSALLSAGATLTDLAARALRPAPTSEPEREPEWEPDAEPPAEGAPEPPASVLDVAAIGTAPPAADAPAATPERPGEPAGTAGEESHRRTSESHTEELAQRPAAEVIRAIRELSTDELEALYDYETSHRNRKSVLAAIERALAPPTTETVYTTP